MDTIINKECLEPMPPGPSPSYCYAQKRITKKYDLPGAHVIAQTNFSTVYQAYSKTLHHEIAIKIIDKNSITTEALQKFLPRELEIAKKVKHPHIARCLHIYTPHPSKVIIVSKFYSGGTLLDYLTVRKTIDEKNAARLFRQLSEALHYLHDSLKVVHRDVKLENILISMKGYIKLTDFGFARYVKKAVRCTSFCGTLSYSSPQVLAFVPYDAFASDWFAAGVVLFSMLRGKWPYVCFVYFLGADNVRVPLSNMFQETLDRTKPIVYPQNCSISVSARELCAKLMEVSEKKRYKYDDVVRDPWIIANTGGN